jgi:NTE family protein
MDRGNATALRLDNGTRIAVVLSAGGLRGAAHVGVLQRLVQHGVPIHALVGVSAGAVIAAYYAAVGLDFDDLIADAERFRGRHLLAHSVRIHTAGAVERRLERVCGVIPHRLRQLDASSFERLHHGVESLGIVCHDVDVRRPRYFSTASHAGVPLAAVVRASAAIPHLFPPVTLTCEGEMLRLTDGGVSDAVPIAFARSAAIGATHVIVSDCRWIGRTPAVDDTTVWIRPRMFATGTLWSPARGLAPAVRGGAEAVTGDALARISRWLADAGLQQTAVP